MTRRLRAWAVRLAGLVGARGRDRDLAAEIASHLQLHIDDNVRAGMTPAAARRAALLKFGGVESVKDAYRDRRGLPLVDALMQDVRYGLRQLRHSPGFAAVAVLSLALGIGANSAIFSILDGLILRSLPVRDPSRLVQLFAGGARELAPRADSSTTRARPELFDGAFAWSSTNFNLAERGETDLVSGAWASAGYFDVLGVAPILGRTFRPADDTRGGPDGPVAVISARFWERRFGGRADVIGKSLAIGPVPFTIIGVTPASFFGPDVGIACDVVIPLGTEPLVHPRSNLDVRSSWWLLVMARLRPSQNMGSATAALQAVQAQMRAATLPQDWRPQDLGGYLKEPLNAKPASAGRSYLRPGYRQPLAIVMGVVGLVLLIACANLANLLLARADARRHEMSVRLALGASRGRLARQLLCESLLLSLAGAALALIFAEWGSRLLVRQLSTTSNGVTLDLSLDWRVLGFTAGVAIVMALLFGTAPAFRATRVQPHDAMKAHGRAIAGDARWGLGSTLVAAQVALCLVLLVGAGLFVRTFTTLAHLDLGFDRDPVLLVDVHPRRSVAPLPDRLALFERLRVAVRTVPGVATAALTVVTPVSGNEWDTLIENPEGLSLPESDRDVYQNIVSPEWFATFGTPIVAGRDFNTHDAAGARPVAIINETLARKYFAGQNPLTRTIREIGGPDDHMPTMSIVGVVRDAVYESLRDRVPPTMYEPIAQTTQPLSAVNLSVRAASGSPARLTRGIAAALANVDQDLALTFRPLADQVQASLARERLVAMLSGFFGVLALLLAGLGLYGVVAYAVSRRRMEIGIRMALGASPRRVIALVVRRVAVLVGAGVVLGGVASQWVAGYVRELLYGLEPRDPATLAIAAAVLAAVGGLASWWPALRAARLDPTGVLREG